MEYAVYFLLAVVGFFIILKLFTWPLKILWKVLLNSIIGLVLLFAFNFLGVYLKMSIPINIPNVLIAGFFGIPGLAFLLLFIYLS
ncbi:MAG TPA: pro-sigmaK processing inhibitor BofA family protein [Clostridiaceae bacterium]